MIRTVTVYTGESDYAKAAQQYAIDMAQKFSARLKVVSIWNAAKAGRPGEGPESAAELVEHNQDDIVKAAERAGVRVATGLRGDGMTRGLLEEARETDLLVLGMPTEKDKSRTDIASDLIASELPVLRKADCALLVVSQAPAPVTKILMKYEDGPRGKEMLRMGAAIAEQYRAEVGVLTVQNDIANATELATAAKEYLKGFDLPTVEALPTSGPTDSEIEITKAIDSFGADFVAMGEEGHSWLERFFGINLAERTALAISIPLLIVR